MPSPERSNKNLRRRLAYSRLQAPSRERKHPEKNFIPILDNYALKYYIIVALKLRNKKGGSKWLLSVGILSGISLL